MIAAVYAISATLAAPGLRAMLRWRAGRGKELLSRLGEREGLERTARPPGPLIWIHAASVGESLSILPLAASVRQRSGATVLITTGTVTSARLVQQRASEGLLHRFVPLDVPRWAARFLAHWRPDVAVFVESELWPNLLAACHRGGIPTVLVNGRVSARSFRGWRRLPGLSRRLLGGFAEVHAQSGPDAERLAALGARITVPGGNLKLAASPLPADPAELSRLRGVLDGAPVWLAASTHPGEEAVIAAAHARLVTAFPGLVGIIVPRHPERGPELAAALAAPLRSRGEGPRRGALWIADGLGELGLFYRLTQLAFVGRSLLPPGGGQNLFEPARLGCAIATGPHTANFADAVARLGQAGALTVVTDAAELAEWVAAMLTEPARRAGLGERARAVACGEQALVPRLAAAITGLLP